MITETVANITAVTGAYLTRTDSTTNTHPSYDEMIMAAIAALNEQNGSTEKTLAKYIESNFLNLPPNHSALLSHHLECLRENSQIVMVKNSYQLPRSAVAPPVSVNVTSSDSGVSEVPKRGRGRPPKAKSVQLAVPVFVEETSEEEDVSAGVPEQPQPPNEATGKLGSLYISVASASEPGLSGSKRGRGRPPKQSGLKRGVGRPPKRGGVVQSLSGRRRGRPKKNAALTGSSNPPGRPPKPSNMDEMKAEVVTDSGIAPEPRKRRGRPPKEGFVAKKPRNEATVEPRKLSGKPLGRPRKNLLGAEVPASGGRLLMSYLDLQGKLDNSQLAVPVFVEETSEEDEVVTRVPGQPHPPNEATGKLGSLYISIASASEPGTSGSKRGRGRPPKKSGRLPKRGGVIPSLPGRLRGRPRKNAALTGSSNPRGQLPIPSNMDAVKAEVVTGDGIAPKAGFVAKKPKNEATVEPRKLSGKPLGQPRKNLLEDEVPPSDSHLLMSYLDLKGKLDYFQSTIKRILIVIKPELNSQSAAPALRELEALAAMDVNISNVQSQS